MVDSRCGEQLTALQAPGGTSTMFDACSSWWTQVRASCRAHEPSDAQLHAPACQLQRPAVVPPGSVPRLLWPRAMWGPLVAAGGGRGAAARDRQGRRLRGGEVPARHLAPGRHPGEPSVACGRPPQRLDRPALPHHGAARLRRWRSSCAQASLEAASRLLDVVGRGWASRVFFSGETALRTSVSAHGAARRSPPQTRFRAAARDASAA